ncbi:MAG: outer membrane lipoprotein-sorting protein [Acidobacteriia bacterium]|nr:outer membrane lipoprotein-sorting protein [Terriglobia bacterium]
MNRLTGGPGPGARGRATALRFSTCPGPRPLAAVLLSAILGLTLAAPVLSQDARQIVEESQRRGKARSERYEGVLEVVAANNKVSRKSWNYIRIGSYGDSKAVIRFTAPAEVKGVALLVVNHPDRSSDQWMWTPAIGRDRRIALQDRSSRFFGTDFSFEDLEERDVNQYDYRLLGEEAIDGAPCWRIESRPRQGKVSQYTLSLVWIRKDNYVPAQYENYVKDQLARRLHESQIDNVQGIWTARLLEMTDLRRKSRTLLRIEKLEYNIPVKDDDFTVQALRREQ